MVVNMTLQFFYVPLQVTFDRVNHNHLNMAQSSSKPAASTESSVFSPEIEITQTPLKQQIFIAVLSSLAGRGMPPREAAETAKQYAEAGVAIY